MNIDYLLSKKILLLLDFEYYKRKNILLVLDFDNYKRTYFVSTGKIILSTNQKIQHHKNFYEVVFFSKFHLYWNFITLND